MLKLLLTLLRSLYWVACCLFFECIPACLSRCNCRCHSSKHRGLSVCVCLSVSLCVCIYIHKCVCARPSPHFEIDEQVYFSVHCTGS